MASEDITREYTYDAAGRLASMRTGESEVRFAYDKRGDLASVTTAGEAAPSAPPAPSDVPAPAATPRFCTNCGAERSEGAQFCKQCGQAF